jgi:hypothetical protein
MTALVLAALLAASGDPSSNLSTTIKASDALLILFKNLDDRIPSPTCDSKDEPSWKGKTVGELLASRLGAQVPEGTERKFSVECVDASVPPYGKKHSDGWACTVSVERASTAKDVGGGVFTFYIAKEGRKFLRGQSMCLPWKEFEGPGKKQKP